jgi:hypothetical protein
MLDDRVIATMTLHTRKPWAIGVKYFAPDRRRCISPTWRSRPIARQRRRPRACWPKPQEWREWPADAVRLDAFDAVAGAGPFYAKCGHESAARRIARAAIYYELRSDGRRGASRHRSRRADARPHVHSGYDAMLDTAAARWRRWCPH